MGVFAKMRLALPIIVFSQTASNVIRVTNVEPTSVVLQDVYPITRQGRQVVRIERAVSDLPGCPGRDRTYDKVVNSHLLYR